MTGRRALPWLLLLVGLLGWITIDAVRRSSDTRVAHGRRAMAAAERRILDLLTEPESRWPLIGSRPARHPFASAADHAAAVESAQHELAWSAAAATVGALEVTTGTPRWLVQRDGDRVRARAWEPLAREIKASSGVVLDADAEGVPFLPGLLSSGGRAVNATLPSPGAVSGLFLDLGRVALALLAAGLAGREILLAHRAREGELAREVVLQRISHELRTPAASIRSLSEALATGAAADPDEARQFLGHIGTEAARLGAGIDRLLRAARGGAAVAIAPIRLDLAEWVHGVGERWRHRIPGLVLDAPGVLVGLADPERLDEAVDALLDNAAKHGGPGVALRAMQVGRGVQLVIEDDGPGVPAADRRRVFERLQRVEGRAGDAGGTGLGLWAASEVARAHGGRLTLEGGSRFVLSLPEAP